MTGPGHALHFSITEVPVEHRGPTMAGARWVLWVTCGNRPCPTEGYEPVDFYADTVPELVAQAKANRDLIAWGSGEGF